MTLSLLQGSLVTQAYKKCEKCGDTFIFSAQGYNNYVKIISFAWLADFYNHRRFCGRLER